VTQIRHQTSRINRRTWIAGAAAPCIAGLSQATGALATEPAVAGTIAAPITSIIFSPDGSKVLAGSQAGVSIRDAVTLKEFRHLSVPMDNVHDLRFTPDGSLLAIAGGNPGEQGVVQLIDWPSANVRQQILHHDDVVDGVDFCPLSKRLVTASSDEVCAVFEIGSSKPNARFTAHSKAVRSVRFLPSGESIVSASRDETLRVWQASAGEAIRTMHNHSRDVNALALRPDESAAMPMIASASADLTIRFWQPTIGRMVRFARVPSEPLSIQWSATADALIAGCADGTVRHIDPVGVKVLGQQNLSTCWLHALAVDPKIAGHIVAGTADGKIVAATGM
tara:strand:- start:50704 stop:51711 length:1008 start_codon:yes stop_codon:yes gene_type:complete